MNDEQVKALKALNAAVRKCHRAGIQARVTYTIKHDDGATMTDRVTGE